MIVSHLELTDFRNYASLILPLTAGATVFVGRNGQGKTNLIESLGFLSSLESHRVPINHAMIRQGRDAAIVRARLNHDDREILVEVQINRVGANRAQINKSPIKTRDLPRYFSSVLFAPEDLGLIRGEPGARRRFLDDLLALCIPRMSGILVDYDRVVRQRNTLLKSARGGGGGSTLLSSLDVWDDRLVELGTSIIVERIRLVGELSPLLSTSYRAVAGGDHGASMVYRLGILPDALPAGGVDAQEAGQARLASLTSEQVSSAFRESLRENRTAERERAMTLSGPHRDDLVLGLNSLPARGYASHGESWSLALALKLASAEVLRPQSQLGDPVIILDDVFAELDESRRTALARSVAGYSQVLVTAAVRADVPIELAANVVHITAGAVV